jgi:signal transduction histidine kinase
VLRDLPSRLLLLLGFLLAGLVPVMLVALMAYSSSEEALRRQALLQLESVRDIKRAQVERFFSERVGDAEVMARDPYLADAFSDLCTAFHTEGGSAGNRFAGHAAGRFDAPEAYRQVHGQHHGFLRLFTERHGFYDMLLLDGATGEVCYSVLKERDFARPAEAQPSLRDAWLAARRGETVLSDTRPYPPSADAAAQFLAVPVMRDGKQLGVIALQISIDAIDAFMGERSGMGKTGETLLIGPDHKMRCNSRLDPARTVEASFRGEVALNGVDTEAARRALEGGTGAGPMVDQHGRGALAAWAPVEVHRTRWALVASVEASEIDAGIAATLNRKMELALLASLLAVIVLTLLLSRVIAGGIGSISASVASIGKAELAGSLDARGDPSEVAVDYRGVLGEVNGLVGAMQRVTEEKRKLEESVARMQRLEAIGTLARGIAHDFNNILTYMHAYADIVGEMLPEQSPAKPQLEQLVAGIDRAADLVQQILAFSRQVNREARPMELGKVVGEAIKLISAALPKKIRLEAELPECVFPVLADATAMHQVALNLLTNAYQAMEESGGTLSVRLEEREVSGPPAPPGLRPGRYVVLRVADTGSGMDAGTLARIFEPYFTTKPVGKGTGMGLALVHGIVTGAGGAVGVESEPGRGAVFEVYLPRTDAQIEEPQAQVPASSPRLGRVLFVDDEEQICRVGRQMIESLGYEVIVRSSPRAASEMLRSAALPFDCLVTDLAMSEMDGLELARAARGACPGIRIVLTTAYKERLDAEGLAAAGIAEVLTKPYRKSDLARVLGKVREA